MPDPFKAYDIRGLYPQELNEGLAYMVGNACAHLLKLAGRRFAVGRDMRLSSPPLKSAFVKGLVYGGAQVVDVGLVSTPALTFAMHHLHTDGGAQVTASHNPAPYGGIKITAPGFVPVGAGSGMEEIERFARAGVPVKVPGGRIAEAFVLDAYAAFLAALPRPVRPLRIAVDGGNGMVGTIFQHLAPRLSPQIELIPVNMDPDGRFPAHEANPLKAENLRQLQALVKAEGADFGAGFDGDGDRCALVDEQGAPISCDLATALMAKAFLAREPGAAVAYDLRSSKVVPEMIRAWGGAPVQTRVGHSYIKKTLKEHHAVLAGELSGHYYFRDFHGADSGLYAFLILAGIAATAPRLSELVAPLRRYHHSGEVNFTVADPVAAMARVRALPGMQVEELDGITVRAREWWCNLRASNTEPVVRLNLEADTPALMRQKLDEMAALIARG